MRCTCEQARREARIEAINATLNEVLALDHTRNGYIRVSDVKALRELASHPAIPGSAEWRTTAVPPRRHAECTTVCQIWGGSGGCAPGVCALLADVSWRTTPPDYPEPELGSPT
jgi:hypothetical protein